MVYTESGFSSHELWRQELLQQGCAPDSLLTENEDRIRRRLCDGQDDSWLHYVEVLRLVSDRLSVAGVRVAATLRARTWRCSDDVLVRRRRVQERFVLALERVTVVDEPVGGRVEAAHDTAVSVLDDAQLIECSVDRVVEWSCRNAPLCGVGRRQVAVLVAELPQVTWSTQFLPRPRRPTTPWATSCSGRRTSSHWSVDVITTLHTTTPDIHNNLRETEKPRATTWDGVLLHTELCKVPLQLPSSLDFWH